MRRKLSLSCDRYFKLKLGPGSHLKQKNRALFYEAFSEKIIFNFFPKRMFTVDNFFCNKLVIVFR